MQAQDATAVYLLKLWPWVEENRKSLITGAAVVIVVTFVFWFASVQREQKQIAAGEAVTQTMVSPDGQTPDAFLKVAADHAGTIAGQRAWLQGAAMLFDQGNYADAQTQFQKFLDANPSSDFSSQALLGVATCLDAQGKNDLAVAAYQRVVNGASGLPAVNAAKFAIARIYESEGRFNDALVYYEDVARSDPNGSLGSEAYQHLMDLRSKMPASAPAAPAAAAPAPFQLSH